MLDTMIEYTTYASLIWFVISLTLHAIKYQPKGMKQQPTPQPAPQPKEDKKEEGDNWTAESLSEWTVTQLKEHLKPWCVKGLGNMRKEQLIKLIVNVT